MNLPHIWTSSWNLDFLGPLNKERFKPDIENRFLINNSVKEYNTVRIKKWVFILRNNV
jgi:hypothetical protein